MSDELLKVQKTADRGNGLFATRPIPEYTLIHREPATLGAVEEECLADVCSYCFLANRKFPTKRCASCLTVSYCSENCQRKDWPIHKQECVFIKKLGSSGVSMMRLLLRCLVKIKLEPLFLDVLNGLVSNEEKIPSDQKQLFIATHMMVSFHLPFAVPENITVEEVIRIGCILKSNTFTGLSDYGPPKFMMFCTRAALFNHSCDPNAEFLFDGRIMRVISLKTIAEGEEVTISYINRLNPKNDRRGILDSRYDFTCNCSECLKESEAVTDPVLYDMNIPLTKRLDIINEFMKKGDHKLFTFYMCSFFMMIHLKSVSCQLTEAKQIQSMLIGPVHGELKVKLRDIVATRDLYRIAMICEMALKGVNKVTPLSLKIKHRIDKLELLIHEPSK